MTRTKGISRLRTCARCCTTTFYKELEPNGNEKWVNDVTQDNTTGLDDEDYAPVPAYFKPVTITNEGTLPTKVKLSLEIAQDYACKEGENNSSQRIWPTAQ